MSRRNLALLVALLGALTVLAPAAPVAAAPVPTFTTDDESGDPDAAPGDGVCATATGGCSLQAALDESIALRRGTIVVDGSVDGGVTAAVRGSITLRATTRNSGFSFNDVVVERGATLRLEDAIVNDPVLTVRGRLIVDRSQIVAPQRLRVDPSGTFVLRSTFVVGFDAGIVNHGRLDISYSTLRRTFDHTDQPRIIQTAGAGATTLLASNLMGPRGFGRACGGTPPTSLGYNLAYDGTCKLRHATDLGAYLAGPHEIGPFGTPRLDAIPAGEAGCGTTVTVDQAGDPRPVDGDGDGTAACDIGAFEHQPT